MMKRFLTVLFALFLVVTLSLSGCSTGNSSISGDYRQDTLALVNSLRTAINLPDHTPEQAAAQVEARQRINDFAAWYRRDSSLLTLTSFTTMRTALNSLAGHYSSYPNRPLSEKLKNRLEQEFNQVETALSKGN